jgi:hypothetical protein
LVLSFYIAMQNRRAMASYWHPQTIISESHEFLIVSRSGGRNEYLSISNAGASTGLEAEAPTGLRPDLVILATLVSQGLDGGEIFLIERDLPAGVVVEGEHVGGDGYLLLTEAQDAITLKGAARLRSTSQTRDVQRRCLLLQPEEPGVTVHFDAVYVPWAREVLPGWFPSKGRLSDGTAP